MAAFVLIYQRDGRTVEPQLLRRLTEPLHRYGGPGADTQELCLGPVAVAVRRASPDRSIAAGGAHLARHRDSLLAICGAFRPATENPASGASATALERAAAWDDSRLAQATGAFALVAAELGMDAGTRGAEVHGVREAHGVRRTQGRSEPPPPAGGGPAGPIVRLVRDPLGSWPVSFHLTPNLFLAATDPAALLRHPAVGGEPEEVAAARFLGFRFAAGDQGYFPGIRQLPSGHRLEVTPDGSSLQRYWSFPPPPTVAAGSPEEVARAVRHALGRELRAQMGDLSPSQVALSLSGGLDSAAVAVVAPRGMEAFTWTFADHPGADEAQRAWTIAEHLEMSWNPVPGDGLHPLCEGFAERFVVTATPHLNPFAALKGRLYRAAAEAGCRAVAVGDGGDVLYAARSYWLRDLLAARDPGAWRALTRSLGGAWGGNRFDRLALARLLPGLAWNLGRRLRPAPSWLTPEGTRLLPPEGRTATLSEAPESRRLEMAIGAKNRELESEEQRLFSLCGVRRINPYWSWPLLRLALQIPAFHAHRDGRDKVLTRLAVGHRLPRTVVEGDRVGTLESVFLHGLERQRRWLRREVFETPRSDWPRYVRRDWLRPYLEGTDRLSFGHTVLWRVVSYELWRRHLAGEGLP